MTRQVIPDHALDILRKIGDPGWTNAHILCPVRRHDEWFTGTPGVRRELTEWVVKGRGLSELANCPVAAHWLALAVAQVPPVHVDAEKVDLARSLFASYGTEITSALLLGALPQAYAAEEGSKVLAATTQLQTNLTRRIAGTGQFLASIMARRASTAATKADWTAGQRIDEPSTRQPCWQLCASLRLYHAVIRASLAERNDVGLRSGEVALNQEDLLGVLLTFSVTVFEVLESYGIRWTTDEQEAYLYLWDLVGTHLGIGSPSVLARLEHANLPIAERAHRLVGDSFKRAGGKDLEAAASPRRTITNASWHGLRPPTIDDTRALLAQIQKRQWPDPGPAYLAPNDNEPLQTTKAGRLLVRALLDELVQAMPARDRLLPLSIMRQLNPAIVRSRLNLGGGGALLAGLQNLPKRRAIVGPFTVTPVSIPFIGHLQRRMGNEVARRASLMYLDKGKLKIPGIDLRPTARSTLPQSTLPRQQ